MENNLNDKSDKSLGDSSDEETETQGGGYFIRGIILLY